MSPIPSVAPAFPLSTLTPFVAPNLGPAQQSATAASQYLVGTGGFVFAVVAVASIAGYFYHGRRKAGGVRKNIAWSTFSNLMSSVRHRESGTATTATTGTGWPPDVEVHPEHVSMVYARFFHPTFWNLIEYHPGTASAPAIYVEDEANEIPKSEPKPYGMNSYLDMVDDDGDEWDGAKGKAQHARQSEDQEGKPRVAKVPPYDTSSEMNVNFKSDLIGTTDRPGGSFLYVLGQYSEDSSEESSVDETSQPSPDSEMDISCSPYDGIVIGSELGYTESCYDGVLSSGTLNSTHKTSHYAGVGFARSYDGVVHDSHLESTRPSYDIMSMTTPRSCSETYRPTFSTGFPTYGDISSDCQSDIARLPSDVTLRTTPRSFHNSRRYGIADMADLTEIVKDSIPEEGNGLIRTTSHLSGLHDLSDFDDSDSDTSSSHSDGIEPGDTSIGTSCGINSHDDRDGATVSPPDEIEDLMEKLLEELGSPSIDGISGALSEHSDSGYSKHGDAGEIDEVTITQVTSTSALDSQRHLSPETAPSIRRSDSDVSDQESIFSVTPPLRLNRLRLRASSAHKARIETLVTRRFSEEAQIIVPTRMGSPSLSPSNGYIRTHSRRRPLPLVYGPPLFPCLALEVA